MMKNLMLGTVLSALMLSSALAQSSISSPPKPNPTPAEQAQSFGYADVIRSQKPDQWLASKFRGTTVLGADGQKIGAVHDILFDKDGKIEAYVMSVGGFLGISTKIVALAPSSFTVIPGQNGSADQLKLSLNKEELKQAENFTPYEPPPTTTGMAPSMPLRGYGMLPPATTPPPAGR